MSEHKGPTDSVTNVTLPSRIEQVQWRQRRAAPGGTATLEVFTHYVGDNAEMTIEISDFAGKQYGTLENRLFANRFSVPVRVPPGARTALLATVRLPKHGLERVSPPLPLTEPFTLTSARWGQPVACRGDQLTLTAEVSGLPDGTEVEVSVWEHDAGGAHERLTRFPAFVAGDRVAAEWEFDYFGDLAAAVVAGTPLQLFYRVSYSGVHVESNLLKFLWVAVELVGEDDAPVPGERYQIELPDGTVREGHLDAHGRAVVDSLSKEGTCKVCFPDLDEDAWEIL